MSAGKGMERPELADIDLSDLPGPISHPAPPEVERRRAFSASLEPRIFWPTAPAPAWLRWCDPEQPRRAPEPDASRERKLRSEEPNLTVRVPEYVQQAVRMRAVVEKTTVRLVILRALQKVFGPPGYPGMVLRFPGKPRSRPSLALTSYPIVTRRQRESDALAYLPATTVLHAAPNWAWVE